MYVHAPKCIAASCISVCVCVCVCYTSPSLPIQWFQVGLIESPGRPGTPVTGERTDLDVARSAALGLWSCSKSKSNKAVSVHIYMGAH